MHEEDRAIVKMAALSTRSRVAALKLLARRGASGMASTQIARELDVPQNTLSTQLQILAAAHLVHGRREGRRIIYTADTDAIRELVDFLVRDCASGKIKMPKSN